MSSSANRDMADRLVRIFNEDPACAMDFFCAASEIVDDFEDCEGLMPGEDGTFDESTAIIRLQQLRNELRKRLDAPTS